MKKRGNRSKPVYKFDEHFNPMGHFETIKVASEKIGLSEYMVQRVIERAQLYGGYYYSHQEDFRK